MMLLVVFATVKGYDEMAMAMVVVRVVLTTVMDKLHGW